MATDEHEEHKQQGIENSLTIRPREHREEKAAEIARRVAKLEEKRKENEKEGGERASSDMHADEPQEGGY